MSLNMEILQHFLLKFPGCNLKKLTLETEFPLSDYKECLNFIICEEPSNDCYLHKREKCPGTSKLKEFLQNIFFDSGTLSITFKQWVNELQCTL